MATRLGMPKNDEEAIGLPTAYQVISVILQAKTDIGSHTVK